MISLIMNLWELIKGFLKGSGDRVGSHDVKNAFGNQTNNITYINYPSQFESNIRTEETRDDQVKITLGKYLEIVIPNGVFAIGTRVHLMSSIKNCKDIPVSISDVELVINDISIFFKQFIRVVEEGRVPETLQYFPAIINAKGVYSLNVEYENIEIDALKQGINCGSIIVRIDDTETYKKEFSFNLDEEFFKQQTVVRKEVMLSRRSQVLSVHLLKE